MNKKISFLLLGAMLVAGRGMSQDQLSLRQKADLLYKQYDYSKAASIYEGLVKKKNPHLQDMQKLADSYRKMNNYSAAEQWYARVTSDPNSTRADLLAYSEMLKANGNYAEAKKGFESYKAKSGMLSNVAIAGCDSAIKWIASPTTHTIKSEEAINTALSEFSVSPSGTNVFYTAETNVDGNTYGWTGKGYLKVFDATRTSEGVLSNPKMADGLFNAGKYHVGPVISNKAGTVLFATRTYYGKEGEMKKDGSKKYQTKKLELIIYTKDAGSGVWKESVFKYNNSNAYSVGHAALSPDEKTLYFVSNMPGGNGGTDLWYSEMEDKGTWGTPKNCGSAVNTSADELFPNIMADGTLYFSSEGFAGMGGLDIFRATGAKDNWAVPENLKYPLNSSSDDFGFYEIKNSTGSTGYFASDRIGGKGGDDIYSFSYVAPVKFVLALNITTSDKKTSAPIEGVNVSLFADKDLKEKLKSDQDGKLLFALEKDHSYSITARREGFLPETLTLNTNGITVSDTLELALKLESLLVKGKTIQLNNIFYDLGKDNIRDDAALVLNGLELILRENPTLKIELSSHTDSRGKDAFNLSLSQRRAQSAVNYLASRGIARERMRAKGYGETRLINKCGNNAKCTEEEHQKNRRTEFTILSF